ncbi:aspartic peptidase domain-containing protein, partial [Talaromyces proteolyticus]
ALSLHKRDIPAVVKLDTQGYRASDAISKDRERIKKDKIVNQNIDNAGNMYLCNVSLGNPAQHLRLILDTGSSDLFCNSASSDLCSSDSSLYCELGTYNASSSSSYKHVNSNFGISYYDGSSASGDYVRDILTIGGATVPNFEFAVAESSSSPGVIGLGYAKNEALINMGGSGYANLPQAMVESGLINSKAYSLWLDDRDTNTGSILFGGVDTRKYSGKLQTLPLVPIHGEYSQFLVNLTDLALDVDGSREETFQSEQLPTLAVLDSGTSSIFLPDSIVSSIYKGLNVTYKSDHGVGYIPCNMANKDIALKFRFGTASISVNIKELFLKQRDTTKLDDNSDPCIMGIHPTGSGTVILGDSFLRSAYVVYDLDNNEISLAKTVFNFSGNGTILEI